MPRYPASHEQHDKERMTSRELREQFGSKEALRKERLEKAFRAHLEINVFPSLAERKAIRIDQGFNPAEDREDARRIDEGTL